MQYLNFLFLALLTVFLATCPVTQAAIAQAADLKSSMDKVCASCFGNDQFFCQDGAGYCVSTRAECKNDATMIKKVVGCSSIVDPVANDDEEPKPEPEPEEGTDDPGPEPEEEIVDPAPEPEEDTEEEVDPEEVVDPEDTTEDTSSSEADKCCAFTFEQWDCSNQRKQDGCKKVLDAIEDFDTKAKKLGARDGDLKKGNKEKTVLKYLMRKKGCAFGPAASVVEKSVYEKRCPNGASYE